MKTLLPVLLVLAVVSCGDADGPTSPVTASSNVAAARLESIGEGCSVAEKSSDDWRVIALPRHQLPFEFPAISRDPSTGRGNGRAAQVILKEAGRPDLWLSCWVPETVGLQDLAFLIAQSNAVQAKPHWSAIRNRIKTAAILPPPDRRAPPSLAARSFAKNLLGSAARSNGTGQAYLPSPRQADAAIDASFGDYCDWGWMRYIYIMDGFGVKCGFGGMGWEIEIEIVFYFEEWYDAYVWTIDQYYWQPYTWCTERSMSLIAWEYDDDTLYDSTAFGSTIGDGSMAQNDRETAYWKPECEEFTGNVSSLYFSWSELKEHNHATWGTGAAWAVIKEPLTVDTSAHYGLDYWRLQIGSAQTANSVYRTPRRNQKVGGVKGSSHMRGIAVDLQNASETQGEYDAKSDDANTAQASFIEPITGPCLFKCVHADWRWWVSWPHQ